MALNEGSTPVDSDCILDDDESYRERAERNFGPSDVRLGAMLKVDARSAMYSSADS